MHRTNLQLKTSARGNLLGHYGAVIAALIVMVLISVILDLPFTNMVTQGYRFGAPFRIVIGVIGIVIVMLLTFVFFVGNLWMHLRLSRGQGTRFSDIMYPFRIQPVRFFGFSLLYLLLALPCILPGFICIMQGVDYSSELGVDIKNFPLVAVGAAALIVGVVIYVRIMGSWFMASYIMLDDPDIRMMESIRLSMRMMKGNRKKWLFLLLSFIGWLLFSILSFGIALIWIAPYMFQSLSCFYLELIAEEEHRESY